MKSTLKIKRLGDYIYQVDVRNISGKQTNLLGVSVNKTFIPSIANTIGTDWKKYKIIKKNQFCYISDTSRRGDKIGIALLKDYDEGLVSQAYTVFYTDETQLLPEYLLLWFMRSEFDRYSRFHSHGSVREIFDWTKLCEVELPIPSIEEQKRIVEDYNVIEERIAIKEAINNNLLKLLDTDLKIMMDSSELETIQFSKYCHFLNGYAFKSDTYLSEGKYRILTIGNVQDGKIEYIDCNYIDLLPRNLPKHCILEVGDMLMSLTGYVGRIAIVNKTNSLLNQRVCKIEPIDKKFVPGILALMRCKSIQEKMNKMSDGGTAQQNLSATELEKVSFNFLNRGEFLIFCNKHEITISNYLNNINEIEILNMIKLALISKLALNK